MHMLKVLNTYYQTSLNKTKTDFLLKKGKREPSHEIRAWLSQPHQNYY